LQIKEKHYWLGFNIFKGIGPKRFQSLLSQFGSAEEAWKASQKKLLETSIPKTILERFFKFRQSFSFSKVLIRMEKAGVYFVTLKESEYPFNLKKISFPPPVLFVKGQLLKKDCLALAVIGTRKITPYGREITTKITANLAVNGFTIVSGLARGVDSTAHRSALEIGGRTIAVLGSGLNRIYPPEHKSLAEEIVNKRQGCLISQVALDFPPIKGHFPSRNRIISGFSLGVLVTEGASVSGTKITAKYCLKQKRKLFAVPGPITSPQSKAPSDLIKKGASLVTKAKDIIEELDVKKKMKKSVSLEQSRSRVSQTKEVDFASRQHEQIWKMLTTGSKHIDDIIRKTELSSGKVLSCLTEMELSGKVKNIGGGNYILI